MYRTGLRRWIDALDTDSPRVLVVAEMANAHEGKLETALELARAAAEAGADAFKLQCFTAAELLVPSHPDYGVFHALEMPEIDWVRLVEHCRALDLAVFADVFGAGSAGLMARLGVDGYKIHASDVPNAALLDRVGGYGKPVLLSCGGATWLELCEARDRLRAAGAGPIVAVYGVQRFPTALEDAGLAKLRLLQDKLELPVGYADHAAGESPPALWLPLAAIGAGSVLVEKHVTLDRGLAGTDYYSSLEPGELARLVADVRDAERAMGRRSLDLSEAEQGYRAGMKKRPVAAASIAAGATVQAQDLVYKRVPGDFRSVDGALLIGRKARHGIDADAPLVERDLDLKIAATLACRVGSGRLYAKPLQPIGDTTILEHLVRSLRRSRQLADIVLAISEGEENAAFVGMARRLGLPFVHGDQRDVLGRLIGAADHVGADVVLRVTPENPFIYHEIIDRQIACHVDSGADITICEELPNGTHVEIISLAALKRAHRYGEDRHRSELCTLFIFENPDLFKIERLRAPEPVRRPELRLTVDTPEDLVVARAAYQAARRSDGMTYLSDVIAYLDANPALTALNKDLQTLKLWR